MIAKNKTLKRAAGYLRMSSDKQDKSPAQQREAIEKLAKERGYIIVAWYEDLGISGDDTERRTGFLQMRDAADSGEFEVVLAWDTSRFGRFDPLTAGYYIHPFRQAGVRLITVAEGEHDWEDFAGRLLYMIQQEQKNAFLVDLSRNVAKGATRGLQARRLAWRETGTRLRH